MKILVAGEINADLILQGHDSFPALGKEVLAREFSMVLGSSSAICAVGLARLGNEVAFLGEVGQDTLGDFCLEVMRAAAIDVSRVFRNPRAKTGLTVSLTYANDRALVTYPGAMAGWDGSRLDDADLEGFRHLHVSSYFLQPAFQPRIGGMFRAARARGMSTSLDPGFDPREVWDGGILRCLPETDVFLPNAVEACAIAREPDPGSAAVRLDGGARIVVVKLGAAGALLVSGGKLVRAAAFPVTPLDTTGAGDSFNAGFLDAWLRGLDLAEALSFGAACGALSTLSLGGVGGQPTAAQVRDFFSSRKSA